MCVMLWLTAVYRDLTGLLQETSFLRLSAVKPHLLEDVQKMVTTLPNSNSKNLPTVDQSFCM